jgi:predicted amidohydrolase
MATFDTIIRGGRVIDPDSGLDAIADVGIKDGRIAAVNPQQGSYHHTPAGARASIFSG